ncbi:MAG: hypothetical protein ACI4TE_07720 [Alphaproteobacteria bacterium]
MFESFHDNMKQAVDTLQEKYHGFTDSVDKFNQDMLEIRDLFVSVKNMITAVFSFIGQETAVLLFCTFLFLFVINLVPFLFFDKKLRYCIGVGFGVFLAFFFDYTAWSLAKYILIMFSPVILEYLLVKLFKITGKSFGLFVKKLFAILKVGGRAVFQKIFGKTKKQVNDEKQF